MSNPSVNSQQMTLANKPANLPALGGQAMILRPKTMQEAMQMAEMVAKSTFCPKSFRDRNGNGIPGDILIVTLQCEQLDITLLQGLYGIAVINGTPKIWGDLGPALIKRSGLCEYFVDDWDEQSLTAVVRIKRKGQPAREFTFSWTDACLAKLDQKDTYKSYRKDMCTWRAKTRAMRTEFPDVLMGMAFVEDSLGMETIEPEPMRMPRELSSAQAQSERQWQPPPEHKHARWDHNGYGPCLACEDAPDEPSQPKPGYVPDDPAKVYVVESKFDRTVKWTDPKSKKERTAELFTVEFSDGVVAGTFSKTIHKDATDAAQQRCPVKYVTKAGKTPGSLVVDSIEPDLPPEAAPQDPPAEAAEG